MKMEVNKNAYNQYVKEVTPVNSLMADIAKAFLTGGIICTAGQGIMNGFLSAGMEKDAASAWTLLCLIGISVLLTGLNLYPKIVKFGGAGALVPITGFANSVAAPAIEFKTEGQVFGIGVKLFTIAGPVILYGTLTSWLLGLVYWIGKMMGIV
jgi:stage V sporulation protein AC